MFPTNAFTHWMRIAIGSFASRIASRASYARTTSYSLENASSKTPSPMGPGARFAPLPSTWALETAAVMASGALLILGSAYAISPKYRQWEREQRDTKDESAR